jgi:hypothetical protein
MTDQPIRRVRCACGWEAVGTFDQLVAATQEHGRRIHNMLPTPAEVEAMLLPLEATADHRAQPGDARGRSA